MSKESLKYAHRRSNSLDEKTVNLHVMLCRHLYGSSEILDVLFQNKKGESYVSRGILLVRLGRVAI